MCNTIPLRRSCVVLFLTLFLFVSLMYAVWEHNLILIGASFAGRTGLWLYNRQYMQEHRMVAASIEKVD